MYSKYDDPGKKFRELVARKEGVFGFGVANAIDALLKQMRLQRSMPAAGPSPAQKAAPTWDRSP